MSMLALLMLLQAPAAGATSAAVIDEAGTITVTATRLEDLAAAAKRCETQGCPTREDIATSVAYASALFDTGNYLEAKRLLAAAVFRTRHAARTEPLALAQLYSAQATLSTHEGDQRTTRKATWASRNVLTEGAAVPVLQRLTAEFRVADLQLRNRDRVGAEARFAAVAADARAAGHGDLADVADLRRALTLAAMRRNTESRALLEALAARTGPGAAEVRRAALATAARIAFVNDDTAAADGYVTRLAAISSGPEPVLVSAPPFPRPGDAGGVDPQSLVMVDRSGAKSSALVGLRWVDIGFRIKPDGSVDDVAVLRGSPRVDWAQPLLGYVGGRRYSGFAPDADDKDGRYRIERYTLTADYRTPVGSLIRRRGANPRFEMMEMSAEAPTG